MTTSQMKDFIHGQPLSKSESYENEILRLTPQNDIKKQSLDGGIQPRRKYKEVSLLAFAN